MLLAQMNSSWAQDNSTKITVFKPEDSKPTTSAGIQPANYVNCIRWNYSLLGRGVFLMDYEFLFQKKLSIEVGLGLTYRDLFFETFRPNYFLDQTVNPQFGYALEGGIKFYPKEVNEFEGFYVSPMVSFRKFNLPETFTSNNAINQPLSSFNTGYNFTDLQFKIGYSYESIWDVDLRGEVYAGVAMRYAKINYYEATSNNNGTQYTATTTNLKLPQILVGLTLGLPF